MSSLDRLIRLAKKTGDRLIVHNTADETDIVIMDVGEYENLLDEKADVRGLSERQLLNQINRDISIWRANDELENECEENEMPDFADDKSDWHSAGSVLENREFESPSFAEALAGEEEIPEFGMLQKSIEKEEIKGEENASKGLISDDEPVFYEEPV